MKDNEFTELKRLTISFIEPVGDIITVNGIPCVTGVNVSFELGDFNDNDDFDSDDGAERLDDSGGLVEFTIRGAFLRDSCGRMLDARPPDLDPNLPGQARPGGDLLFPFFVLGTRRHGHNRDWENNYD